MRYAITIIFNAKHHLLNQRFIDLMVGSFDKWIIVEGFSSNGGSTAWCHNLNIQKNSTDGTLEFLAELMEKHSNIIVHSRKNGWKSKDEQVNKAIELLQGSPSGWLWQVDIDELWNQSDFANAESLMEQDKSVAGAFQFHHLLCQDYKGRQLVGKGEWGSNWHTRLWWWEGQDFISHEPPLMKGQKTIKQLPQKYHHYSYYYEQDVQFKSKYYKGYASLYRNWKRLQKKAFQFPISTRELFGNSSNINHKNSTITHYESL